MTRQLKNIITAAIVTAAAGFIFFLGGQTVKADPDSGNALIYLEDVDVTDMDESEIQAVIDAKMSEYATTAINLDVYGENVSVIAGELGLYRANTDLIDQIMARHRKGNILQQYAIDKYYKENGPEFMEISLDATYDACYAVVTEKCKFTDEDPIDMTLVLNEIGALVPTEKRDGHYIQVEESANKLVDFIRNQWHGGKSQVNLPIKVVPGYGTKEQFLQCDSVLGTATTRYPNIGVDRDTNLMVAAGKLNGCVVYPGEIFSVLDHLMPFTEENGYMTAPVFLNGKVVDDIGGGACQISTTLYQACLYAELEIVDRSPHSMMTVYCEPAMDAAVAEGYKDFKFRNNTDSPIYISSSVGPSGNELGDGIVVFTIYGHETRDPNRTIEFESVETNREKATTVYELSNAEEFGMVLYTDGHDGVDAVSYKIVKINGEVVEKSELNHANYQMAPNTYTIGIKGASSRAVSMLAEAAATKNIDNVYDTLVVLYDSE